MAWNFPRVSGAGVLDPRPLIEAAQRLNSQTDFIGLANSITCPVGIHPGSAYFLVPRTVVDGGGTNGSVNRNNVVNITWTHQQSDDFDPNNASVTTWKNYVVIEAHCVGLDGDSQAAYMLELRDKRHLMFAGTANKLYNVSDGVNDDGEKTYLKETLKPGGFPLYPWTWQEILENLWSELPFNAGACPTLPWSPSMTPDTIRFVGVSAWEAIGDLLAVLQSVIVLNPLTDVFTIARLGQVQGDPFFGIDPLFDAIADRLMIDDKPKDDCKRANVPDAINFTFPRRTKDCEQQEDAAYVDSRNVGNGNSAISTELTFWLPLISEWDEKDATEPLNESWLDLAAGEFIVKLKERIEAGIVAIGKTYSGLIDTIPNGSEVHWIRWRDVGDQLGLVTEFRSLEIPLRGMEVDPLRKREGLIWLLPFELMQDRTAGAYEERLPVILIGSYGAGCDLPESNPDAEALIDDWSTLKATYPNLNAQLAWYHDTQYPHAMGPMEAGDGGDDEARGAIGLLAFHPDISLADDDEQAESEFSFCKKRFEVITSDQRAMFFETQAKFPFPYADDIGTTGSNLDGDLPGDNGTFGDDYYILGLPVPLSGWPFSQREHTSYWHATDSESEPGSLSVVKNPLRYCGATGDTGIITYRPATETWELVSTQVRNITAIGALRFSDCAIESSKKRFRAYSRVDGGEFAANWETEIQLYSRTKFNDLSYAIRASNGVDTPVGDETDVCVLVADYEIDCNAFTESPAASGQYNTAAVQYYVKGVKEVVNGSTDITFTCHYVFSPCYELVDTDCDVVIEGDDTCPA
jgi:hypothetical protein